MELRVESNQSFHGFGVTITIVFHGISLHRLELGHHKTKQNYKKIHHQNRVVLHSEIVFLFL